MYIAITFDEVEYMFLSELQFLCIYICNAIRLKKAECVGYVHGWLIASAGNSVGCRTRGVCDLVWFMEVL